ncbi:hypothetical protein RUND412_007598 [Rhizina undulata]
MSTSSSSSSPTAPSPGPKTWQAKLEDHCNAIRVEPPQWQLRSDRRGGRTAWSSTVTIGNIQWTGRYWYDGDYTDNAKEDVAELALKQLKLSGLVLHSTATQLLSNFRK